jgi:putative transposase
MRAFLLASVTATMFGCRRCRIDTAIVQAISAIRDEFECYGWRVRAELRHGMIVDRKKIRRLMCEHGLPPRSRRRYAATTDSDHDQPIYPSRTKDVTLDGPNRLWVADISVPQQAA